MNVHVKILNKLLVKEPQKYIKIMTHLTKQNLSQECMVDLILERMKEQNEQNSHTMFYEYPQNIQQNEQNTQILGMNE